jgi:hypothetical protein
MTEIPSSVAVQGDAGKRGGKAKFETWYAKILGFDFGTTSEGSEILEVDESDESSVNIVWFHNASEPMAVFSLLKSRKGPEHQAIQEALDRDLYLLGTVPQLISLECIEGKLSSLWTISAPVQ